MITDKENGIKIAENDEEKYWEEIRQSTEQDVNNSYEALKELKKAKKKKKSEIVKEYRNMIKKQVEAVEKGLTFQLAVLSMVEQKLKEAVDNGEED